MVKRIRAPKALPTAKPVFAPVVRPTFSVDPVHVMLSCRASEEATSVGNESKFFFSNAQCNSHEHLDRRS